MAGPPAKPAAEPTSPTKVLADAAARPTGPVYGEGPRAVRNDKPDQDRTLAPYLTVVGQDTRAGVERLPLKETSAKVSIAGVIARVEVRQLFENNGHTPIEAVYVFPASTRAAVHGVRMKIGNRVVEAKIDRRQAARESYESAKREGKRASLLEQERPNVFTMNVANIMPGDRIAVELDYSEMLVPEDATYELIYPTVVGPRYGGGADPVKDKWIANPHLPAGTPEPYKFDIRVHLETAIPIKELTSPSHDVAITYAGPACADVRLNTPGGGNRDFVLRYRLAGEKIESGLLLWEGTAGGDAGGGRREGFFALMMEPPRRPTTAQIPPREYIFLLDVSGSMHGFPLDTAKTLMRNLLSRLRPSDLFNVVLFSGAAHVRSPKGSVAARAEEVAAAIADIEGQHAGGGTELMGGLEMSYRIPKARAGVSRTVVVVTDGYVGVESQAFRFIRNRLSEANLFAFGIGSSVNRGLIEGMARAGQGEPFVVLAPEKAAAEAEKLRAYIEAPVLTGVNVVFSGFDAYEVAPAKLPDLMARRPLVLFGKYRGSATGRIEVTGTSGGGQLRQVVEVKPADVRAENGALRWLWARRWIDVLDDERAMGAGKPAEEAITNLGLEYRLLTAFTSFVAVDSQLANPGGRTESVRQPLPMPDGVSDLAVATVVGTAAQNYGPSTAALGSLTKRARGADSAPMAAAEAPLAPPPSPQKGSAKTDLAEGQGAARAQALWSVSVANPGASASASSVATAIQTALNRAPAACASPARTTRVRVTVGRDGKISAVDLVDGDRKLLPCLQKRLHGLAVSAAGPQGTSTTVEVILQRR